MDAYMRLPARIRAEAGFGSPDGYDEVWGPEPTTIYPYANGWHPMKDGAGSGSGSWPFSVDEDEAKAVFDRAKGRGQVKLPVPVRPAATPVQIRRDEYAAYVMARELLHDASYRELLRLRAHHERGTNYGDYALMMRREMLKVVRGWDPEAVIVRGGMDLA